MMKKFSDNSKGIIRELITIIVLLIMVAISLLADYSILHIPNFFVLSIKDVEKFFYIVYCASKRFDRKYSNSFNN